MKSILCLILLGLVSCKQVPQTEKEYVTPEEKKVLEEIEKNYKKN